MSLSESQAAAIKALIISDPTYSGWFATVEDWPKRIAEDLNSIASPDYWVYRIDVQNSEIGDAMDGTEIAGLSALNMQRAQMLANYSGGSQDFSRFDRRDAFTRIFSGAGGVKTRTNLAVVWRRQASKIEQMFAVVADREGGNTNPLGSTLNPAAMTFQGAVGEGEIVALFG
jgi:hypothetical protein